jgi:hypothetical protein
LNWIGAALATPTKIIHILLQMGTMNRTIVTNFPCTYSVGYLWTLDYDNEPPIAKQIELNRCSALAMPAKMQHITGGYEPKNCHKLSIHMFNGISLETRPWQRTTCCEAHWVESMQLWRCEQKCNI